MHVFKRKLNEKKKNKTICTDVLRYVPVSVNKQQPQKPNLTVSWLSFQLGGASFEL